MPLNRTRTSLLILFGLVATLAVLLAWVAVERRNSRLMMADRHGALQAEEQARADGDRQIADILDGKVDDPIRPFLNTGDTGPMRSRAADHADRASYHAGLRADYLRSAARPWEPAP
jgi:hypothetical protein